MFIGGKVTELFLKVDEFHDYFAKSYTNITSKPTKGQGRGLATGVERRSVGDLHRHVNRQRPIH